MAQRAQQANEDAAFAMLMNQLKQRVGVDLTIDKHPATHYVKNASPLHLVVSKKQTDLLVKNNMGVFTFTVASNKNPLSFLHPVKFQPIYFTLPKIPWRIFQQLEEYYRDVYLDHGTEAYAQVWYDVQAGHYFVDIPDIILTGAHAHWEANDDPKFTDPNFIMVVDSHSHHDMNIHYSGIDDNDHQGVRIYAMINNIMSKPKWNFRIAYGDFKVDLDEKDLKLFIDFDDKLVSRYPSEWKEKADASFAKTASDDDEDFLDEPGVDDAFIPEVEEEDEYFIVKAGDNNE